MRASSLALAALKIAIRSAAAALTRWQHIVIHANAHAATRIAPFETRGSENFVEAFALRLSFHDARPGNHQRSLDVFRNVLAGDNFRGHAQIVNPRIRAGAYEYAVHGDVHELGAGFESHIFERTRDTFLLV